MSGDASLGREVRDFLLVLALSLLVYAPSLSGGFISDDVLYVQRNELFALPPASALVRLFQPPFFAVGNWAPTHLSFLYVEHALFGETPLGYRLTNVLLLAACAFALRLLARRAGVSPRAALLAAALLVVHPALVEAVAWINQSKTLLALLFSLLALERWLANLSSPSAGRLTAALALAATALLAKSAVVLLPLLFAIAWYSHGGGVRRDAWAVALLAAFAAYVTLINLQAQGAQGGIAAWFGGSPAATARILPGVLWRYPRLALLPYDPVFCVQPDVIRSWLDLRVWLPLRPASSRITSAAAALRAPVRDSQKRSRDAGSATSTRRPGSAIAR